MSPGVARATLLHVVQAARRRSTIIEVAAKANVAFSTVSRVLNGGYASPAVRARVARNREAARTLTEHLISLGHRRFAFLGGPDKSADAIERLGGLHDALAVRDLVLDAENVLFGETFPRQGATAYGEQWQAKPRAS